MPLRGERQKQPRIYTDDTDNPKIVISRVLNSYEFQVARDPPVEEIADEK